MNLNLAAMYGTAGAPASEDQVKLAEAELFTKIAADNGIDLNLLTDDQVQSLWDSAFAKTAEDGESKEDEKKEDEEKKDEEKKEAAAREHQVKLAQAEEEQRAHYLGQVMAHSYVAELSKIAAARDAAEAGTKEAGMPPQLAKALGKVKSVAGAGAGKAKELAGVGAAKVKDVAGKGVAAAKSNPGKALGGAAAAAGGAGFMAGRASKKEASVSNLDELALDEAVKIAHAAGLDPEVAAERISAVATLGLEESSKLASTVEQQVNIRALEYLEAAGYPVTWDEPTA